MYVCDFDAFKLTNRNAKCSLSGYRSKYAQPKVREVMFVVWPYAREFPRTQISPLATLSAMLVTSTLPGWI